MTWHTCWKCHCALSLSTQTQHTPRFSGAQHHHYLLDFLQLVAKRYLGDGRAGDLVMDLLKLKVPKLFAVENRNQEDEKVRHRFSAFLRHYILRWDLRHTILGNMMNIMVRKLNSHMQMSLSLKDHCHLCTTPSYVLLSSGCNLRPAR